MVVKKITNSIQKRKANSISLRLIPIFTVTQNNISMKRIHSLLAVVLLAGALMSSCGSQKKACAAYSSVEYTDPADNC